MSTFRGIVSEFPQIRIDFFRRVEGQPPPLVCFLSHIHSDHLAGLDSLRSPFVYCSAATREILLRLERYPCRINYANGILEARQQTYKHLSKVLKPIPLETPTVLELEPGFEIQVTLFDANHCPGAVMFLIERSDVAILYTGDLRSEPWFVNSIARHPVLAEYTSGIRRLNKIYLDTSFTDDVTFQTKAEGIAELLRKVSQYPPDTIFYFQTWTYGYEDVWLALSKALKSPIHVDEYKMDIYTSLSVRSKDSRFETDSHHTPLAPALTGYMCGNSRHPGCLTLDENVRLHSCEKGNLCNVAAEAHVVKIQPIVAHLPNGSYLAEAGVGGGGNDFQREGFPSLQDVQMFKEMLRNLDLESKQLFHSVFQAIASGRDVPLNLALDSFSDELTASIEAFFEAFKKAREESSGINTPRATELPRVIRFPYARHSSYEELCHFVDAFKPLDVWPCTEDAEYWWRNSYSIESYFGHHCSGSDFAYDNMIQSLFPEPPPNSDDNHDTQTSGYASLGAGDQPSSPPLRGLFMPTSLPGQPAVSGFVDIPSSPPYEEPGPLYTPSNLDYQEESQASIVSQIQDTDSAMRQEAYQRTLDSLYDGDWGQPSLLSTDGHHSTLEREL